MVIAQVFNSRIQKHGSFEDFMIEFARTLHNENSRTIFIFPDVQDKNVKQELESTGSQVYIIQHAWYSFRFIINVINLVLKDNPQTLDFHFCASLNFILLFFLLRLMGKKIIFHYHGEIRPIEELSFLHKLFSRLYLLSFFSNKIICVSEANKKFLLAHNIKKEITVIYNGIKIENFINNPPSVTFKEETGFDKNEFIITSIGSLIPRKGYEILINAAKYVLEDFPQAKFIIIGGGNKKKYEDLAKNLKIQDNIIFTGLMIEYPFQILKATDLYVSSSFSESFGLSIAEAQLMGIPVVASKVGGVPEVIEDNVTGILVPPGNSKSLSEGIKKILKNPELRIKMGLNASKRIVEKFNLKDKVTELICYVS